MWINREESMDSWFLNLTQFALLRQNWDAEIKGRLC